MEHAEHGHHGNSESARLVIFQSQRHRGAAATVVMVVRRAVFSVMGMGFRSGAVVMMVMAARVLHGQSNGIRMERHGKPADTQPG